MFQDAMLYLARTFRILLKPDQADEYYLKSLDTNPANPDAHLSYGAFLLERGDVDGGVAEITRAAEMDPKNSEVHAHLAYAYRVSGAFDRSLEEADLAVSVNPANAQAYLWLGEALRLLGRYEDAKKAYGRFVRLTQFDPGFTERLVGQFILGIPFFNPWTQKGASQKPAYRDQRNIAFFGLCECEERTGNFNLAITYCSRAIQLRFELIHIPITSWGLVNLERSQF